METIISYMCKITTLQNEVTYSEWCTQPTHCSFSSHSNKYKCVTLVCPKWSGAKTTSFLMFRTTDRYSPIVGFISRSLFPMLLFHEVYNSPKIYLLTDGLKLFTIESITEYLKVPYRTLTYAELINRSTFDWIFLTRRCTFHCCVYDGVFKSLIYKLNLH